MSGIALRAVQSSGSELRLMGSAQTAGLGSAQIESFGTAVVGAAPQTTVPTVELEPIAQAWSPLTLPDQVGVMVGADAIQEDLLPHWYEHYLRHNAYPIQFVDFGLSIGARDWCAQRGTLIDMRGLSIPAMYRKPIAMLRSPYGRTAWLDTDTQVDANIGRLFDMGGFDLHLRLDHAWMLSTHEADHLQAGVLAYRHGAEVIRDWASWCALGESIKAMVPDPYRVLDQQVLTWVVRRKQYTFKRLDHRLNWMFFEEALADTVVTHWAGIDGKIRLRQQIDGDRRFSANMDQSPVDNAIPAQAGKAMHR
jgi:hypothetical protein